jgi:D-cysteine desulfhydrase
LLADALASGCDTVITGGGAQSNHCRATALAATRLGLSSVVCLRTVDKSKPPATVGNILLDRLTGAEIVWIDHDDWARQGEIYAREAACLRGAGKTPYIIPEGGSNALGAWGYIDCARELAEQIGALPRKETTLIYACGSGGTGAGLILGGKHFRFADHDIKIAGVNVCDSREYFVRRIADIGNDFAESYQSPGIDEDEIHIIDGYVGLGYAKSRPEELACLQKLAATEAIILDPVYTGKAFYGLTRELERNKTRFGERVVFLHTGGIFGLFPAAEQFESLWQGGEG